MTASSTRSRVLPVLLLVLLGFTSSCTPALAEEPVRAHATLQPTQPPPTPAAAERPAPDATPELLPRRERTPEPTPSAPTSTPAPLRGPFAMNLFEAGDFVQQHTFDWCVGASIQMAWNLVRPKVRGSYADQQALWEMARDRSENSFGGANPHGWASVLSEIGLGPYELVSVTSYREALRTAAAALRATGRPVGLVMWSGRHAWVMSGFESLGDPAIHPRFRVTGIRVLDPLYPHGSGMWGASPAPNSLLTPKQLAAQFVVREARRWSLGLEDGYLLVLPT